MAEPSDSAIGLQLGSYVVESFIGAGGMGSVYLGRHVTLGRVVAVKVLSRYLCSDDQYVQRFLREAKLAASLHHPNLVEVYDFGESKLGYFMAMEFIQGMNLGQLIQSQGKLTEQQTLEVAVQALSALTYAHDSGVIHRDIKPDNLLLREDGNLKLTDLGLAKGVTLEEDQSLTMSGMVLGTPLYIPPEQVRGDRNIDGRADLYSLGGTLYHCVTGKPPYAGATSAIIMDKHLNEPVPHPRHANPEISDAFAGFIIRLMQKNPDYRFITAKEAGVALDEIRGTDQAIARRVKEVVILDEEESWTSRLPSLALKLALVVALLSGGWWFWKKHSAAPPPPAPVASQPIPPTASTAATPPAPEAATAAIGAKPAPETTPPRPPAGRAVIFGAQVPQIIRDGQVNLPGGEMSHVTPVEVDATHQMFLRFDVESIQDNMLRKFSVAPDIRRVDLMLVAQIQSGTPATRIRLSRLEKNPEEGFHAASPFATINLPKSRQNTRLMLMITEEYLRIARGGENFGWILSLEGEGKILVASSRDPIQQAIPGLSFSVGIPEENMPADTPAPP